MPRLMIVVASVRPGRIGLPISEWAADVARDTGDFEIDFVDLAQLSLPLMNEPNHPRLRQYTLQHTLDWSARVDEADAFLFVTPEYNHSFSPALKNALDYLSSEWWRKPVGFVSYGGVSAGSRGVVSLEPVLAVLGLVKTGANLELNFAANHLIDGVFVGTDTHAGILRGVCSELLALSTALAPLR